MRKKIYMKASRRRDGFIEKPFEKLTDKLICQYSELSQIEVKNLTLILEASPHLFEADSELSIWNSINKDLNLFKISNDLSKIYNYEGGQFSLKYYLIVRAEVEDNPLMFMTALALNVALDKAYYLFHNDIDALARIVDVAYYNGEATSLASFQREVIAGQFRTSDTAEIAFKQKEKRIEITRIEAKKLRKKYPKISKDGIAEQIFDKVGVSKSTVREYLKKINLSD